MPLSRRQFVGTLAGSLGAAIGAPALVGLGRKTERRIAGGFADDGGLVGHQLRDRTMRSDSLVGSRRQATSERHSVVIVGGGIAGLSAAWELDRQGHRDFIVLELDGEPGGNSRFGENEISAYPWAAHYVPVPDTRATFVRELFTELGVLNGDSWDERHLCFAPQERLFMHGRWQPGLEPSFAIQPRERHELLRFEELIAEQRASGQFTIPMALGASADSPLDRVSFADWLRQHGLASPALLWHVNYACRDDYGALAHDTSAWAGVHYFASRTDSEHRVLTWPEGNGWIVKRLLEKLGRSVRTGEPALHVERARPTSPGTASRWHVHTPRGAYIADAVIFAAPTFVAPFVVDELRGRRSSFTYSPWLTANLVLDRWPTERGNGSAPPAWDNVLYDSVALGYVVATHQSLRAVPALQEPTVWTYYWSLGELPPREARALLARRSWTEWCDLILADLERAHPDIRDCVSRIDVMRMAHAMVRPTVGFLRAPERSGSAAVADRLYMANSDRSGLALFEEAQYRGIIAARRAIRDLG